MLETLLESVLEIFWTRKPGLFTTILRVMRVLIVRFFTVIKSPSTIRFVAVWWRAWPKGLFRRRRSATISIRKNLQCSFLESFSFNNMRSENHFDRFFGVNLPFPSKYFQFLWCPSLRFLIFVNVDYTKSNSTLGLEEKLFV